MDVHYRGRCATTVEHTTERKHVWHLNLRRPDAARARDLGIVIGRLEPGPWNAITDVPGVLVGHTTLIQGDGPLVIGQGPVRTGVTVILPREHDIGMRPVAAGYHVLNGNGEMTGTIAIEELGMINSPDRDHQYA